LSEALPTAGLKFEQTDHVGALVGKELATKSALALALGLLGIFIYVSFPICHLVRRGFTGSAGARSYYYYRHLRPERA
jgi:hypothetical protein